MTQTVTAHFDHPSAAQVVVEQLIQEGFDRGDIGTLAQDVRSESERMLSATWKGLLVGAVAGLLLAVWALFIPRVELALAGVPFAPLAGAALGALVGGLIGAFSAQRRRRDGVLVTVAAGNAERAARAAEILTRHGGTASGSRISSDHRKPAEYPPMRSP
jgi:uncharacterized integral membrane protein